jgi:cytochrome b subunit of formate dehydrogenase
MVIREVFLTKNEKATILLFAPSGEKAVFWYVLIFHCFVKISGFFASLQKF